MKECIILSNSFIESTETIMFFFIIIILIIGIDFQMLKQVYIPEITPIWSQ